MCPGSASISIKLVILGEKRYTRMLKQHGLIKPTVARRRIRNACLESWAGLTRGNALHMRSAAPKGNLPYGIWIVQVVDYPQHYQC